MIARPIITEKSMKEAGASRYVFAVGLGDTKTQIAQEVGRLFGVKVTNVATSIRHGKTRRAGKRRSRSRRADWKMATVTIDPKQKIELFETKPAEGGERP